jgi:hypothetical protein
LDVLLQDLATKAHVSRGNGDAQSLSINSMLQRTGRFFKLKSWLWIGARSNSITSRGTIGGTTELSRDGVGMTTARNYLTYLFDSSIFRLDD